MGLTLQFIPYVEIEALSSLGRIRKLLNAVKEDKIVLLEGRLKKEEEAELIKTTMEEINSEFKGIELAVISGNGDEGFFGKMKQGIANALTGGDLGAITIIGPATLVKEIKRNPKKIELMLNR